MSATSSEASFVTAPEEPISTLESLPTDVLERVFRYSGMNLAFPRATPHLGRCLSGSVIKGDVLKQVLIDLMFDEDLKNRNMADVQSDLLGCKWVDEDAFTTALQDNHVIHHIACFGTEFKLLPGCTLPSKVLKPWSPSKLRFLNRLLEAGAKLNWDDEWDVQFAETSLRTAIVQGNVPVVKVLLGPLASVQHPKKYDWPFDPIVPVMQKHLELAVFRGGCVREVVRMLLHGGRVGHLGQVDVHNNRMSSWALDEESRGNPTGAWLLRLIESRMD
ncbi:MAG: hypothetical protein Q9198_005565 [Flavoplaca austrocitrina]